MGDVERDAAELRELVREGHQLLRDLRAEHRAVRATIDAARPDIERRINQALEEGLDGLRAGFTKAVDDATERVFARFDELFARLTGAHRANRRRGRPSLDELAGGGHG